MEIVDIVSNIIVVIAMGVMLYSFKGIWNLNRETKRLFFIAGAMSKHRWLLKMGMKEQARHFNAFGLRSGYNPNKFGMWY